MIDFPVQAENLIRVSLFDTGILKKLKHVGKPAKDMGLPLLSQFQQEQFSP
jgi:hypothetical protein